MFTFRFQDTPLAHTRPYEITVSTLEEGLKHRHYKTVLIWAKDGEGKVMRGVIHQQSGVLMDNYVHDYNMHYTEKGVYFLHESDRYKDALENLKKPAVLG